MQEDPRVRSAYTVKRGRSWHLVQAYRQDLHDHVLRAEGSIREVAARFGVGKPCVARARSRRRRLGEDTPRVQCSHMPLKLTGLERALIDKVDAVNDLTLKRLCEWLQTEHGVRVGISTLLKALAQLWGEVSKKSLHASEQTRSDVVLARQAWQAEQPELEVERLVFLDETWASCDEAGSRF